MSDQELIQIIRNTTRETVLQTLKEVGFKCEIKPWVSFNYSVTHILKPHGIGRVKLETAMRRGIVIWKTIGNRIYIKRDTLNNLINYNDGPNKSI